MQVPQQGAFGAVAGFQQQGFQQQQQQPTGGIGSVLLVNRLNEAEIDCDKLFILFGVYGDVQRVKILYNKKDTALIQLANPHQANLARQHLDKLEIYGNAISVAVSKHAEVSVPNSQQSDSGLTKDFSNNPLHRFKMPGSKNERHITAPSVQLHLSNLPQGVTQEELQGLFMADGKLVFDVKMFKAGNKEMAFVSFNSVSQAAEALIKFHNHPLRDRHLRITFSHAKEARASRAAATAAAQQHGAPGQDVQGVAMPPPPPMQQQFQQQPHMQMQMPPQQQQQQFVHNQQ
jgi:polypyrimidine tract-binding protein 2